MRSIIFTSLVVACAAAPVLAGPPEGCFVRHYTDSHLAGQPAQVVASIWLDIGTRVYDGHAQVDASMGVVTADQGHVRRAGLGGRYFDQFLICWQEGNWRCAVECDGGHMEIIRYDGKVLEFRTRYLIVGDTGGEGCGGSVDLAEKPGVAVVYRLYRAKDWECEAN